MRRNKGKKNQTFTNNVSYKTYLNVEFTSQLKITIRVSKGRKIDREKEKMVGHPNSTDKCWVICKLPSNLKNHPTPENIFLSSLSTAKKERGFQFLVSPNHL